MTYIDIELAIVNYFGIRQNIIVPNCYITFGTSKDHECDLLIIKRSGYAFEVEIKVSKADLKADLKKKHSHEDERLKNLYYAMPKNLYEECKDLIPINAGAISINQFDNDFFASIERFAPNKKCRKLTDIEQLKFARLGVMRVWGLKNQLNKLS